MTIYWMIAGPNGAGKTTFALDFLPLVDCQHFINADAIAGGHSIPTAAIDRRFAKSLRNLFERFEKHADHTMCFMNHEAQFIPVFETENHGRQIFDQDYDALLTNFVQS